MAQRTELALRALHLLEDEATTIRAKEMAPQLGTTANYLPQVLRPLVQAGWLESLPGPTGGYRLISDLADHSLLDLIEMIEGPTENQTCVLKGGPCDEADQCAMHSSWLDVRNTLLQQLSEIPISTTRKVEP